MPTVIKADLRDFLGDVGRMWGWYPVVIKPCLVMGKSPRHGGFSGKKRLEMRGVQVSHV